MNRLIGVFLAAGWLNAQAQTAMVERVGDTGFIQIEAESFRKLTPRQQELAYWLTRASVAIDPIIYDQLSRFGLRQKALLEDIVSHPAGVDPAVYKKIANFTKLFWVNKGNHNEMTGQKAIPDFTFDELKKAAGVRNAREASLLYRSLFDPEFEPSFTVKSPKGGQDILEASSNTFYRGVKVADLKDFAERYPLNSRLVKSGPGQLVEIPYRAGTPDGKVAPGLYAEYLGRAIKALERAAAVADPEQAKAIAALIRYYQTGDPRDWIAFGILWVQNNSAVDFVNGFVEVYRDARGAKGSSQSFVSITDESVTAAMRKIAANAQYFEDRAPWLPEYRKQGVAPPVVKAVETLVETGDFHVSTIGDNLPNENEIHEKYGSKSFLFTGSVRAMNSSMGDAVLKEFAGGPEEIALRAKFGGQADELLTSLHEIIGHGSGKLSPKLEKSAAFYLKEYYSTLEETRADLMAMWNIGDPKLRELGLAPDPGVAKAMYYAQAATSLTQLRRIPKGDTIEEDHQRGRQLMVNYIMAKTGAIEWVRRNGKTYVSIRDFDAMRRGVGMLLAELMRIKAEGDYAAIRTLIDEYGVHFDTKVRDEIVGRFEKLNLPTYFGAIHPQLEASFDAAGKVTGVTMSYPRDIVKQQLYWAAGGPTKAP